MSDEEDVDLALLRSAALASIKKKQDNDDLNESEDLETLRKMALTSRKLHNQNPMIKRHQSNKSSNLITPTTDSKYSSKESESERDESQSSSSSSEESRSDPSSSEDEDSSASEETKTDQNNSVEKEVKEEDDLLDAIDQFLDEGVMMLEQVTDVSPKDTKKKKNAQKTKPNKKEKSKITKKSKNSKIAPKTKPKKKKVEKIVPISKPSPPSEPIEKPKKLRNSVKSQPQVNEETMQSVPVAWNSDDLPLNEKTKQNVSSDSVHSSDLSFLSSSKSEDEVKVFDRPVPIKPERKFIRISRHKLDELKKENSRTRRFSEEDALERESKSEKRSQRPVRAERKLPDLRDKLKRRGLSRRKPSAPKDDVPPEPRSKKSENGSSKVPQKIYVKPSVMFDDSSLNKPYEKSKVELPRALTDRLLTRKVKEDNYSPLTISLTDGDEKRNIKSFRRKRSVVQYKPEESPVEKQLRLENIKKKAHEARKIETESLSDLSEDFGDFEIEEPTEMSSPEEDQEDNKNSTSAKKTAPKIRVSSPVPPKKNAEEENSPLSDYDEEADEELGEIKDTPPRRRSSTSSQNSDENVINIRSKVKISQNNAETKKRSRRRVNVNVNDPLEWRERPLPIVRKAEISSRIGWRKNRVRPDSDEMAEEARVEMAEKPRFYDDRNSHKKRKQKTDPEVFEPSSKKPLRHRLGLNKTEPRTRTRKRSNSRDFPRKTTDREKEVDAKIQRIKKQNDKIAKRRLQIEREEREFRLKPA